MSEIIRISLLAMAGVLLAVLLHGYKPEYATAMGMAMGVVIFSYVVRQMEGVVNHLDRIRNYLGQGEQYLAILLKVIGITYICEFGAGICKDAGYGAMGTQIEIFAKLSILAVSMPVVLALMETLKGFLA